MTVSLRTAISQETDVQGSEHPLSSLNIANEQQQLGIPVGPSGSTASIISINGNQLTIVGLSGLSFNSEGHDLYLSNCATLSNNGNFLIVEYLSSSSAVIVNGAGVAPDANNGNIIWQELYPYSLEADLNYTRTDRKEIKGVDYYQTVATYQRPDAIGTDVPTNLSNISAQTTDAVAYLGNQELFGIPVLAGQSQITVHDIGHLKHVDPVNTLGIPCFDQTPFIGDFNSCFVKVLDGYVTGAEMTVLTGPNIGNRIFGVTFNGTSITPDSIQVAFYSCPPWQDVTIGSSPYIWESGQPNAINVIYNYNSRLDSLSANTFVTSNVSLPTAPITGGGGGGGITPAIHETLRQLIHFLEDGPGDGFLSDAYKTITPIGSIFPTNIIWWTNSSQTEKIVEKIIVWAGIVPSTITWNVYQNDGVTIAQTAIDTITYTNQIFESSRTRTLI